MCLEVCAHAGKPVGSLELTLKLIKIQNGAPDSSFVVLKYMCYTVWTIYMYCTQVSMFTAIFNFTGISLQIGVLDIAAYAFRSFTTTLHCSE